MFKLRFYLITLLKFLKIDTFFYKLKFFKRRIILFIDCLSIKNKENKSGVLLIRLDAIGDFIIWLDSAKEYRANFPDQRITLLANSLWADLAANLPYWDEVIGINVNYFKTNLLYRSKVIKQISNNGFLISIHPNSSRSLLVGDSIIRASCSKIRIGAEGDLNNIYFFEKKLSNKWYTKLIDNQNDNKLELIQNSHFVSKLFNKSIKPNLPYLPISNLPNKILIKEKYFIIAPGASWIGRQWSIESFTFVINKIATQHNLLPVLCGSNSEKELCQNIIKNVTIPCLNLAGNTNLPQLVELIRDGVFVLANESSSVHIATAVKTISFCITGGGHFGRFVPYPINNNEISPIVLFEKMDCYFCNWNCRIAHDPSGPVPCISKISPDKVVNEINLFLTHN